MHSRPTLRFGLIAMTLAFVAAGAYVLWGSLKPTDVAIQSHILTVNLAEIPPGAAQIFEVTGGPIYIVHRTKEDLADLDSLTQVVRDPNSTSSRQPAYAKNPYRSIKPEWFISFGFEHHRGLPVRYTEHLPQGYEGRVAWFGGFFDRYDGALFDKAGRVYSLGHPDETNLPIPEHKYVAENTVAIYPFGL